MLKIEKDIPIPTGGKSSGTAAQLRAMNIGDSVFFANKTPSELSSTCSGALGRGNYVSRTVEGGARVWRTK